MEDNTRESRLAANSEQRDDAGSDSSATDTADEGDFEDALEDLSETKLATEAASEPFVNGEMEMDIEKLKQDIEHGLDLSDLNTNVQSNIDSFKPDWVKSDSDADGANKGAENVEGRSHLLASRLNAEIPMEDLGSESENEADEKEVIVDEDFIKQQEALLSEEELETRRDRAQELKTSGNSKFKEAEYEAAVELYIEALEICPRKFPKERSIMYSNRAACRMHQTQNESAVEDCSKALELNPNYLKALVRRAELYEKLDKLEEALADYQKALEMDPSLYAARGACMRLPDQIKERNEKMKEEMLGKLKELGNMVLKPFGLSTNNFQLNQDPQTGSYSVAFQQGAPSPPQQPPQQQAAAEQDGGP